MTFKLELITTTDNGIIETSEVNTFKEVISILDANTEIISKLLNEGNRKVTVDYNNINLFSFTQDDLTHTLDFKDLANKLDLSLLNFSPFSLILQEYVLNKNNTLLNKYNDLKIPNIALIRFKNGKAYCIDDFIVDDYVNVDVHFKIKDGKIVLNLINKENIIKSSSSYFLDEVDEVIFMEFNKYTVFELNYKNTDYV